MTIGEKIKHHRKMLGFTQTELGNRLGVKTNAVSKWECGRVEDIPTSKIKAMALLFGVPPSYLIDEEMSQNFPPIEPGRLFPAQLARIIEIYNGMNSVGQEKLFEYAEDLSINDRYKKDDSISTDSVG